VPAKADAGFSDSESAPVRCYTPRVIRRVALLLAVLLAACVPVPRGEKIAPALREEIHHVPVAAADVTIVVTTFRPRGNGPFPWLVLSHGTHTTAEANRAMGRYRPLTPVREWVRRGYAVVVPVRRGYGVSGGEHFGDSYGTCARPDFRRAGEGAALDLLATVEWAKAQPDLDPRHWLLVGQSSGGFASIYTASKRPAELTAVLAFAPGRGGRPDTHPGEPCHPERMAELFRSITPRIAVPVLWFYAENDQFIGPAAQKLWFETFRSAGGRGELVVLPPFPTARGHGVFPSTDGLPLWPPVVAAFFHSQGVAMPF
jgi:dienelactone hydrolase